jgi:hypothetical protein
MLVYYTLKMIRRYEVFEFRKGEIVWAKPGTYSLGLLFVTIKQTKRKIRSEPPVVAGKSRESRLL